jgi:hypothetical protein
MALQINFTTKRQTTPDIGRKNEILTTRFAGEHGDAEEKKNQISVPQ